MSSDYSKRGFTLVELSIVLVIIGLIVGGVLAGRDLIRAATLRAVIKEVKNYETVIHIFRDKYGYLPADMPNARDYWPACNDNGANPCNGDGDGTNDAVTART